MKWTRQTEMNEKPIIYNSEDGDIVKFKAGDEPWTWDIYPDTTVSTRKANKVIEQYVTQGINQHDYEGGFNEAVQVLEVN
jgi:hypothetical protein